MRHVDEELLAAVALGDLADLTDEQRDHCLTCADCQTEITELRDLSDVVRASRGEQLVVPPSRVWDHVAREASQASVVPLVRQRRGTPWLAAAACAAIALGGGYWWGRAAAPTPPENDTVVMASVPLDTLTDKAQLGTAKMRLRDGSRMYVDVAATKLAGIPAQSHREVWLINVDGKRMVSIGLLGESGTGSFEVSQRLLDEGYRIVDISDEPDDGNPTHSGASLVRGTLPKKA